MEFEPEGTKGGARTKTNDVRINISSFHWSIGHHFKNSKFIVVSAVCLEPYSRDPWLEVERWKRYANSDTEDGKSSTPCRGYHGFVQNNSTIKNLFFFWMFYLGTIHWRITMFFHGTSKCSFKLKELILQIGWGDLFFVWHNVTFLNQKVQFRICNLTLIWWCTHLKNSFKRNF